MENLTNFPKFLMQVPSAKNISPQPETNPSYPGVHRFWMDVNNNTLALVPAGDGPTNRQSPVSSLEDLKCKVFSEAMDQYGSHFLHQKLQEREPEDIQMIFSEVKDCICKLMVHRFGSYVIQKLFEVCDEEQMNQLVSSVTADARLLMLACLDPQGSESMKNFLGCLMTRKQISHIISIFSYFTVPLVNHEFGSLVIGHCFHIFSAEETEPILKVIANNCMEIAVDESGSCLLRDLISKDSLRGTARSIFSRLSTDIYGLSENQFGNLIVQHLIGLEMPWVTEVILDQLTGAFATLSSDEYASNVVKKLMEASNQKYAPQIINDIISSPNFSNYLVYPCSISVLQTGKKYSKGTVRKTLNDLIRQHSELKTPS